MCIDNIGACDARNLEESCGQGGRGDLRMVKVSPSWPWLVAWTSPSTCTRALSHRENMRLWMGMKAQNAAWPVDGIPDEIFMGRDMAKWGSGEASGAPEFPLAIDQIGIGGVRTIELDGLRGLLRLVRRSGVAHLRHDRTLVSRVLQLISGNPIILMGQKGREICLGMGSYQPRSVARPSDRGAALECFKC